MADPFDGILERATAAADPGYHRPVEAVLDPLWPLLADRPVDELCALWIEEAPRFGAVAAHFPESLRKRRFVAGFWAVELFMPWPFDEPKRGWYWPVPGTRSNLDACVASEISLDASIRTTLSPPFWAPEVLLFGDFYGRCLLAHGRCWTRALIDQWCALLIERAPGHRLAGGFPFWSPELPEVQVVDGQPLARTGRAGWFALMLLLVLALPAGAQTLFGVVSKVSDGDTLTVGEARIRLYGIDAPEIEQWCGGGKTATRCGERAKRALEALAPVGSPVSCRIMDSDRYGRLVAVCSVASRVGSDLARDLVLQGWAVAYRKYSDRYVAEETAAKNGKRGLWAGSFEPPEEWRHGN